MDTERMANVSLIEPARPPLKPVSPRVLLNIVLGVFLGGFGGLGLACFVEDLDDSLEWTDDVEECLDVPVLASIPEMKK
jgi:capsular polysaccharide biosynthesis protein